MANKSDYYLAVKSEFDFRACCENDERRRTVAERRYNSVLSGQNLIIKSFSDPKLGRERENDPNAAYWPEYRIYSPDAKHYFDVRKMTDEEIAARDAGNPRKQIKAEADAEPRRDNVLKFNIA